MQAESPVSQCLDSSPRVQGAKCGCPRAPKSVQFEMRREAGVPACPVPCSPVSGWTCQEGLTNLFSDFRGHLESLDHGDSEARR